MKQFYIFWLRVKKFFIKPYTKFHWRNIPFGIAHCDRNTEGLYQLPNWVTNKLAEFDCENKHYIIFIKK